MHAITVVPMKANTAEITDVDEPDPSEGALLVETLSVGVCGTDVEIVQGEYGWAPPGKDRLVLGHESLGRVLEAPSGSGFTSGDLVVAIVRRPDPVPCHACAVGQWDACENGQYTEHGIKSLDGFMRERYRAEPDAVVKLDKGLTKVGVLLEPTTIVAKAWDQLEAVGRRSKWDPEKALVIGAGPIGLLAAMIGVQRGYAVTVLDHVTTGAKPDLVRALGARYVTGDVADAVEEPDIVVECTGVPKLIFDAMAALGINGVLCLTGVSAPQQLEIDAGTLGRSLVLGNRAVVGSVNANRKHYEEGATALAKADTGWLERLVSRRVEFAHFGDALQRGPDDVKVVIDVTPH